VHERNPSPGRERHTGHAARKRTQVALHRRDTILEAVSFAAERFLEALGWKRHIQAVLERLGVAAGVSRVYMFENHVGASGELLTSQRYEWVAPGVAPQLSNPELQGFSYRATGFERWAAALGAGELIYGPIRTFPPTEQALLASHDIHSIAVVPIYVGQIWWGHVGFDDCRTAREWTSAETDVLKTAARIIGAAIERERSEAALRESEQRYRQLVEISPEPIAVHSSGRIVYINPAGVRLLGAATPEELIGRPILDFVHPDYHAVIVERVQQTQTGQQTDPLEEVFVRLDGQLIDVEVVGIPTTYLGNPATQVIIRDIRERKRIEAERLAFERRLLETQKLESLGVLAGGIAHDFNNLLMGVLGNASLALLELPPGSPVEYSIRQIEDAARRAAELTRQMLVYAGKEQFVVQAVSLSAIVEEMSRRAQVSFGKSVSLQRHLDNQLPRIQADAAQMRQLVMNLVINASEAIGDAAATITLTTGVRRLTNAYLATTYLAPDLPSGSYVYLEVADTGRGMDAARLARIFEPFFTTRFTGRGLGLSAVLGIVRGHRGALHVQSELGRGTTFTIFLPTTNHRPMTTDSEQGMEMGRQGELPSANLLVSPSPGLPVSHSSGVGMVLVIEDDPSVRALAARMLKHFGYDVLTADDGHAGVAAFYAQPDTIDCILLDMSMPHMDGAQVLQAIRRIRPDARVVLMSGHDEREIASQFAGQTLASVLQKPFTPAMLREHMRQVIE
jgi:two-component system, cell cycle sensor histidine kinase and response regulator CckA